MSPKSVCNISSEEVKSDHIGTQMSERIVGEGRGEDGMGSATGDAGRGDDEMFLAKVGVCLP
jgi:hypothetical protein